MPEKRQVKAVFSVVGIAGHPGIRQGDVVDAEVFGDELERQIGLGAIEYVAHVEPVVDKPKKKAKPE